MPGAVIVVDQPLGSGASAPGVTRNDLWLSRAVQLAVGVGGNTSFLWELVAVPPGSAASLASPTTSTPSFTPDVAGSYRVRLTTNGGGPGNVKVAALRVRYSSTGVLLGRGWYLPAFGERLGEDNVGGNTRGYAPVFEDLFADLLGFVQGLTANALVRDTNNIARYSADFVRNESDPKVPITSFVGSTVTVSATPVAVPVSELASGDVLSVDAFLTVRNASGSVNGRWRLSSLAYHTGGGAVFQGTVSVDFDAKKSDVALDATLIVSGDEVLLQITPIAGTLTWGWEIRCQEQLP